MGVYLLESRVFEFSYSSFFPGFAIDQQNGLINNLKYTVNTDD